MGNTFQLGTVQQEWIKSLKENPERQHTGSLGWIKKDGSRKTCCLGELCFIASQYGLTKITISEDGTLKNNYPDSKEDGSIHYIADVQGLGLITPRGSAKEYEGFIVNIDSGWQSFNSLANMNDNGVFWEKIAEIVEANPSKFFTKSY